MTKVTSIPLYAQIKSSILSRIVAKEWGPGSFLPSETALAAEYGVSQGTLRKALNELALEKKLVRFQGKGTAVAVLDSDGALFPFFRLYDDDGKRVYPLSQMTSTQYDMAKKEEAIALGIEDGDAIIRIHRIRVLDEQPVINEFILLPSKRFPGFHCDLSKLPNTLYEYYFQQFDILIAKATESLQAVMSDPLDMKSLRLSEVCPLLEIRRKAFDIDGKVVEIRRSRVLTIHHCYHTDL